MGKRNADNDVQYETPNKTTKLESLDVSNISSYSLSGDLVDGTILTDLTLKDWRIGRPIGEFLNENFRKSLTNIDFYIIHI